jgi:hypothetical protein
MGRKSRAHAESRPAAQRSVAPGASPPPGSLAGLVALGALSALWSLFLWAELLVSRAGGVAFCALGDADACPALWDAPFAAALHRVSGLPVAAWGVVWGLVAFALPLLALSRAAQGTAEPALVSAVRIAAAAGVVAVLVLFGVSLSARTLCLGCIVSYALVAGYAGIALYGWQTLGLPQARRGAALAGGATLAVALALLYPGLKTPESAGAAGREAIASAPDFAAGPGTGDAARDRHLEEFVTSLPAPLKQSLADSLHIMARSPVLAAPPPRHLEGPAAAPVRITEWTDVLCDHCADLHETLGALRERFPDAFNVDSRQFPLDGACNPLVRPRQGESVRCLAAKALICLEGPQARELAGALFAHQKSLSPDRVYALAEAFVPRAVLERCVASEPTRRKLEQDVRLAGPYDPDGTPIVAVNGRQGTSVGAFLYAMILTGGTPHHPAFRSLPAPNPQAHLH